jgi:Ca2+-binding EF-hand superfamily protein
VAYATAIVGPSSRRSIMLRTSWRALAAGVAAAAALGWADAGAQPAGEFSDEQIAFMAADTDGDGEVSLAELARDAARGFAALDKDGSGTLTPEELGPHDDALFRRVDTNGDGKLTFEEVTANKVRAFETGDKDKDGGLSFQEMESEVEAELGGAS